MPKPGRSASADVDTLAATARGAGGPLRLVAFLKEGARVVPLPEDATVTVGRAPTASLCLEEPTLSRTHFRILPSPPRVEDLKSANGTRLNGRWLQPGVPAPLDDGSVLQAGGVIFAVQHRAETSRSASAEVRAAGSSPAPGAERPDPAMARLHQLVEIVARTALPVLVTGETGTGKELVAEAIHLGSPRASGPLVKIHCAELRLDGRDGDGSLLPLESADGGTVFLDEIGEMPLGTQAKLLRLLEGGGPPREGSRAPRTLDVRFVAATSHDLPALVAKERFRKDLYYRLNGITIAVPPLRERPGEIVPLARQFLEQAARHAGVPAAGLSPGAITALTRHVWPGNVRELRNVIERAHALARGGILEAAHVLIDKTPDLPGSSAAAPGRGAQPDRGRMLRLSRAEEQQRIADALERADGNQRKASELLGISRRTLINRLDEYGMVRPRKKRS